MLQSHQTSAPQEMERAIAAAQSTACRHAFVRTGFDEARSQAANPRLQHLPLAGLAVSVKDLFDLQGQPTPAGSVVLADAPAASASPVAPIKVPSDPDTNAAPSAPELQ